MRIITLVVALLSVMATDGQAERVEAPKIQLVATEVDFGTIREGEKAVGEFVVKNVGRGELELQRLLVPCGCTSSELRANMVEPGQEVRIPVSFLTEGFPGKQRKVVKLFSNDPDQPVVTMTLRGTVEAPLVVEPRQLIFGDIVRGSEQSLLREVSVRVADGVSGAISSVVVPDSLVVSNEERGARSWRAQIRPLQELKGGDLREQITIVWDGGRHVIPVFGVVQGRVSLSPMAVAFGVVDDEAVKVRSATLLVRGGERVQVTNVRGSHPAISGRAVPEIDGYRYRIEITLDPTKLTGDLRGSLTVHTGGSDNGRYTLGVFSVLPPRVD